MKKLLLLTVYIVLFILLKYFGLFQPLELTLYDHFWQRSPIEAPDERIVIVGIDEQDLNEVNWPITNDNLANLILKIESQQPVVVGLDIFRDLGVTDKLKQIFQKSYKLIGVGMHEGVAFPETLKARERVGTVEVVTEPNFGELRRIYLYSLTDGSKDAQIPYLSLKLVWEYLKAQGNLQITGDQATGYLKVNGKVIPRSEHTSGGYNLKGYSGYPYLVRWRKGDYKPEHREDCFKILTYTEAMASPPDTFTDKIVIIGYRARSIKDQFITPLGWRYGVDIVAQTTSDLISHIEDNRPIFRFIPEGIEYILLIIPIFIAYVQANYSNLNKILTSVGIQGAIAVTVFAVMYEGGYRFFRQGWWIPVAQSLVAYLISILLFFAIKYLHGLQSANQRQQVKLAEQAKELNQLYEKRSIEEKQIFLGQFASNLTHDLNTQLSILNMDQQYLTEIEQNLLSWLVEFDDPEDYEWVIEHLQHDKVEEFKKCLESQGNAIARLRESLEALQTFYRKKRLDVREFDLNQELQKIISRWTTQLSLNNISISLISNAPISLVYSQIFFRQIINHLIQNSVDAITEKQIERGEITIIIKEEGNKIKISIIDNGIGMTPETQAQAFDFLFSTKSSGMGYGLHFVKTQLGENIVIDSTFRQGTIVSLFYDKSQKSE